MFASLLILLALVAAAIAVGGVPSCRSLARLVDARLGQAGQAASHVLAALLRSVPGCQRPELIVALARPAPADARQQALLRARLAAPPARPRGGPPPG